MSAEQIRRELEAAKKHYELDFLEEWESKLTDASKNKFKSDYCLEKVELPALTVANVAKVEAMIRADSKYAPSDEYDNKEYLPYWMRELGKYLGHPNGDEPKEEFDTVIKKVVERVDVENSTHLNADGVGRKEMAKRIIDYINQGRLLEYLKNRDQGFEIIGRLSEKTEPETGSQKRGRRNISFASKFCHYACFYIFEGEDAQDNFSIYDSVVAEVLTYYLEYWRITDVNQRKLKFNEKSKDEYKEYSKAINEVIGASGSHISRNGFDHLLWYYFKDKGKK